MLIHRSALLLLGALWCVSGLSACQAPTQPTEELCRLKKLQKEALPPGCQP